MRPVVSIDRSNAVRTAKRWLLAGAGLVAGTAWAQQESVGIALDSDHPGGMAPQVLFSALVPPIGTAVPDRSAVGFQWRQPPFNPANVDITAWRRLAPTTDAVALVQQQDTLHGVRVEVKLKSASARSVFEDKFVGLRLDSGARIGLKKSNGGPTMYYRNQF